MELDKATNSERFRIRSAFFKKKRNGLATPVYPLNCRLDTIVASPGQTGAALRPAAAQDLPAAFGGHAFAKSVVAHASTSAGLKRSFHYGLSFSCLMAGPAISLENVIGTKPHPKPRPRPIPISISWPHKILYAADRSKNL